MRRVDRPRDPGSDRPRDDHERSGPPDTHDGPAGDLLWGRGGPLRGDQQQAGPPADQPPRPAATDGERATETGQPPDADGHGAPDGLVAFLPGDPELPDPETTDAEVPSADMGGEASETAWLVTDHAYDKHVERRGEYPEIANREQFARLVDDALADPTASRTLPGERTAYWHEGSKTLIIVNERSPDRSTAFRPREGKDYFDGLH